jgi:hypothetical protein
MPIRLDGHLYSNLFERQGPKLSKRSWHEVEDELLKEINQKGTERWKLSDVLLRARATFFKWAISKRVSLGLHTDTILKRDV